MSKIIAIVNHKGGVGKTTTTLNLGKYLVMQGKKVLILDLDPQANLSQSLGIIPNKTIFTAFTQGTDLPIHQIESNWSIVPSELALSDASNLIRNEINGYFKVKKLLDKISAQYDIILMDCPPSLEILTINALIAANFVLIPSQAEILSVKGIQTTIDAVEQIQQNLNIGLKILGTLMTRIDARTAIHRDIINSLKTENQIYVFQSYIRQNIALTEATYVCKDIFSYNSAAHGAEDYSNFGKEFLSKID